MLAFKAPKDYIYFTETISISGNNTRAVLSNLSI